MDSLSFTALLLPFDMLLLLFLDGVLGPVKEVLIGLGIFVLIVLIWPEMFRLNLPLREDFCLIILIDDREVDALEPDKEFLELVLVAAAFSDV